MLQSRIPLGSLSTLISHTSELDTGCTFFLRTITYLKVQVRKYKFPLKDFVYTDYSVNCYLYSFSFLQSKVILFYHRIVHNIYLHVFNNTAIKIIQIRHKCKPKYTFFNASGFSSPSSYRSSKFYKINCNHYI